MGSAVPRRITALYATLGVLWIVSGDFTAGGFAVNTAFVVNVAKGSAFVFVTSALLYVLLRRVCRAHDRAEQAVHASEARYRALFEAHHAPMLIVDPADGHVVDANPAALRFYGYAREELLRLTVADLSLLSDEQIAERIREATAHQRKHFEAEHCLANGEIRPVDVYTGPIELDGRRLLVSLVHDASARHAAETRLLAQKAMAEQANRAKSEFLATMSHELRTPLNAILGFSEMIRSRMLGDAAIDRYADYADAIQRSGRHLLELINDILDLSKIEAKRFELVEQDLEIATVVAAALTLVETQRVAKSIRIDVDVPADLPLLRADRRAVEQVLINLLDNAIKFSPPESLVTVTAGLGQAGDLALTVADHGDGISEEEMPHLFEPFHRQSSALARRQEGTGLGLSISRRLVELHGGTLGLASGPGEGTTATLCFPARRVQAKVAATG